MLRMIARLLRELNSSASPAQLSGALVLGMIIGLTPLFRVHNLLVLFLAFGLRIHLSAFFLAWGFFASIAWAMDPWFEQLGSWLLHHPALQSAWTAMYQSDLWKLTRFNHTLTLGSLLIAVTLVIPFFMLGQFLINNYRAHIMSWVQKSRLVQFFRGSRVYHVYQRLSGSGDRL